ncbi:MAG TPA: hypothetical protein VFJ16_12470 [Longimicrobium sp.]|nr:hypothetical protein [Longimicrobium sp.]
MRDRPTAALRRAAVAAVAAVPLVLAACSDRTPTLRTPEEAVPHGAVTCTASLRSRSLDCATTRGPNGARAVVVGGQGVNVQLRSNNVSYDAATHTLSADITVQNLMPEALGTGDWITLSGVRVFFASGPTVVAGQGTAAVANADGEGIFTTAGQPYFHYAEPLAPNAISSARTWRWTVDPSVATFTFSLYVEAARDGDDPGTGRFTSLTTGGAHACATTPANAVYCWGAGSYGQVGSGEFAWNPAPVREARHAAWRSVFAGIYNTCGTRIDGTTWCWGRFTVPQSIEDDTIPCDMAYHCRPDPLRGGMLFRLVTVGAHHACGITNGGDAYCWGAQSSGSLGTANAPDTCDIGGPSPCAILPVAVEGGIKFNDLVAGVRHTCGIERGGLAYCWGFGRAGERGDGTTADASHPVPVAGGIRFAQIDTYEQTTCGLTPDGQAWCWGSDWHGQLGAGSYIPNSPVPVKVVQGDLRFHRIAVGHEHVCGIALTGEAWCWGGNTFGQLGDGTGGDFELSTVPVQVSGGLKFRDLDAGAMYTCGITRGGDPYCWGISLGQEGTPGVTGTYRCHYEQCSLVPGRIKDPVS